MTVDRSHPATGAGLVRRSLAVLREGQHSSGAYVACPTYPTYRYAWLRDGSFCAYAMDIRGEHADAAAFHRFVARTVLRHLGRDHDPARAGAHLSLPTRYTLTGDLEPAGEETWP